MNRGFTYKDIHSGTFPGLFVKTSSFPLLAAQSVTRTRIPGRDGDLLIPGAYGNKIVELQCTLAGGFSERRATARKITAWLGGEPGRLVMDYEADKAYQVLRPICDVYAVTETGMDSFSIRFECEPAQYGQVRHISGAGNLTLPNNGTAPTETIIQLNGYGMIRLGPHSFTINATHTRVNIDSKRMLVYSDSIENLIRAFKGDFLKVPPGGGTMYVSGEIEHVTVWYEEMWY